MSAPARRWGQRVAGARRPIAVIAAALIGLGGLGLAAGVGLGGIGSVAKASVGEVQHHHGHPWPGQRFRP